MVKNMVDEQSLLHRAIQYDKKALVEVYDEFSPGIYRYAMRLLGNSDLAEDCVAETFSRFLHALQRHKGPQKYLKAYLYRIAHNWISDHYRREKKNISLEATKQIIDGDEERTDNLLIDEREMIRKALAQLTETQRQVLVLKYLEGWDNHEISLTLKKPVGSIKSLQHRALVRLRKLLQGIIE